jgi:Family of unknown function (DUF6527)
MAHVFVSEVPRTIEPGTLYVSISYATAVHVCPGCERKVVTPFAPASWHLTFDGETVSISPSIWNKAHECRSHYWIDRDRVVPARWGSGPAGNSEAGSPHESGRRRRQPDGWFRRMEKALRSLRRDRSRSQMFGITSGFGRSRGAAIRRAGAVALSTNRP